MRLSRTNNSHNVFLLLYFLNVSLNASSNLLVKIPTDMPSIFEGKKSCVLPCSSLNTCLFPSQTSEASEWFELHNRFFFFFSYNNSVTQNSHDFFCLHFMSCPMLPWLTFPSFCLSCSGYYLLLYYYYWWKNEKSCCGGVDNDDGKSRRKMLKWRVHRCFGEELVMREQKEEMNITY